MKAAKWIFLTAGVFGLLTMVPMAFTERFIEQVGISPKIKNCSINMRAATCPQASGLSIKIINLDKCGHLDQNTKG